MLTRQQKWKKKKQRNQKWATIWHKFRFETKVSNMSDTKSKITIVDVNQSVFEECFNWNFREDESTLTLNSFLIFFFICLFQLLYLHIFYSISKNSFRIHYTLDRLKIRLSIFDFTCSFDDLFLLSRTITKNKRETERIKCKIDFLLLNSHIVFNWCAQIIQID